MEMLVIHFAEVPRPLQITGHCSKLLMALRIDLMVGAGISQD